MSYSADAQPFGMIGHKVLINPDYDLSFIRLTKGPESFQPFPSVTITTIINGYKKHG